MPIHRPGELAIGIGAGLFHLGQSQVHAHAHQGSNQGQFVLTNWCIATGQVRKWPQEARPIIQLQQQIRQLDLRKHAVHPRAQTVHLCRNLLYQRRQVQLALFIQA
jgi:hypothetical protein